MIDFKKVKLTGKPNQFLMVPEGFECHSTPHDHSPSFDQTKEAVQKAILQVIQRAPRTVIEESGTQIRAVQRSKIMRFPDTINIEIMEMQDGKTSLAILSSSKYGYSDWGVNKARIEDWIHELTNSLVS